MPASTAAAAAAVYPSSLSCKLFVRSSNSNGGNGMSHDKLYASSAVNYNSVSTRDELDNGHFRVDMKENSDLQAAGGRAGGAFVSSSAVRGKGGRKGVKGKDRHAHFDSADSSDAHEHGGLQHSNGHAHQGLAEPLVSAFVPASAAVKSASGLTGGRVTSPVMSPRMSPRACGGLGPRALQRLDKAGRKGRKAEKENAAARRKLWIVSVLCLCFMTLEIIGGFLANSLAIMTDAAHLLSDLASFLISIFALWLATRAPTSRLSFGFHRAEILGALISVIMIWLLTGILVYEAVQRIRDPEVVDGRIMFIVACCGLGVNLIMGVILYQSGHQHSHGLGGGGGHGHSHGAAPAEEVAEDDDDEEDEDEENESAEGAGEQQQQQPPQQHGHSHGQHEDEEQASGDHGHSHAHSHSAPHASSVNSTSYQQSLPADVDQPTHSKAANINVSAAFIHVLGDALQSVGVMIAAGLIWYSDNRWSIADPICTFVFSLLVLVTTARLVKQSVGVLMEGAPEGIDPQQVEATLHEVEGVLEVHDLHVWSLSVGKPSLSVHLLVRREDAGAVLKEATAMLGKRFNIHHSTIQVEREGDDISCNEHWK